MATFTIIGGKGFIGSSIAKALRAADIDVFVPGRYDDPAGLGDLGHVIYCAGVTADFRSRPYDTMEAHVTLPARLLRRRRFRSFLYLSSTRLYDGATAGAEDAVLNVDPMSPSDLYNLSKLSGEALCLNEDAPHIRVARLSNVYGAGMFGSSAGEANFLASVVTAAVRQGHVRLSTSPASAKDYVYIGDVVRALVLIAAGGTERLYNVASGENTTHEQILDRLSALAGCDWSTENDPLLTAYPRIRTERISNAFAEEKLRWQPESVLDRLPELIRAARKKHPITQGAVA